MTTTVENQKLTLQEANDRIKFCDSYSRLPAIINLFAVMNHSDWLRLVGQEWTGFDNIGPYRVLLHKLFVGDPLVDARRGPARGPIPELMDDAELVAYEALPEIVTCYRGCGPENMLGASWSLHRNVAAKFPTLNRYHANKALLLTGRVRRSSVLAVKLDRNEQEIITFSARRIAVDPLPSHLNS